MENNDTNKVEAKPFLKWAGGKKQVINFIEDILPAEINDEEPIKNYVEPFLGGGALFFHLASHYEIEKAYLGDINNELILTYKIVKDEPKKLISKLKSCSNAFLKMDYNEQKIYFNDIRREFNDNLDEFDYENFSHDHIVRAAQMIFLNKTCFNGLYRVNKSGKFNVPMGRYKNPLICDENNLLNVSEILNKINEIHICAKDYSKSCKFIGEDTFVYLDPPYLPIKKTSFTSYSSEGFGIYEQKQLSKFCKEIDKRGAKFILSNSDPKNGFFKETYSKLNLKVCNHNKIDVNRYINSKGNKRGPVKEILIYNF